jgi:hypothetical protein
MLTCLQEDHLAQYCPRNPNRPWVAQGYVSANIRTTKGQDAGPSQASAVAGSMTAIVNVAVQHASMHTGARIAVAPVLVCTAHGAAIARPRSPLSRLRQQGHLPGPTVPGQHYRVSRLSEKLRGRFHILTETCVTLVNG